MDDEGELVPSSVFAIDVKCFDAGCDDCVSFMLLQTHVR